MKIYEKVKFCREANSLSQENLAFELGLNQSQYSRRESGIIKFNIEEIKKISHLLSVSTDDLLDDQVALLPKRHLDAHKSSLNEQTLEILLKQFEERLKEKDEMIDLLTKRILFLEKLIEKNKN